jgi:hypothetical protein
VDETAAAVLIFKPENGNPFQDIGDWCRELKKINSEARRKAARGQGHSSTWTRGREPVPRQDGQLVLPPIIDLSSILRQRRPMAFVIEYLAVRASTQLFR